jgi:hypothetical protein
MIGRAEGDERVVLPTPPTTPQRRLRVLAERADEELVEDNGTYVKVTVPLPREETT